MGKAKDRIYVRSIDRRWRVELARAEKQVLVFSPYLTPRTAELVLASVRPSLCTVYTSLSIESFASGASSIDTLRRLADGGYAIREIDGLHAKVVIVDERFASIGSQNLTSRGVTNSEASVVISDSHGVQAILEGVRPWVDRSRLVTPEVLSEIARSLPAVARSFRKAKEEARKAEEAIREGERLRRLRTWSDGARRALRKSTEQQWAKTQSEVTLETARRFVRASIYWLTHPTGHVPAPAFQYHISGAEGDWRLKLGANSFLVGAAIYRCMRTIDAFLSAVESGGKPDIARLSHDLRRDVAGAVADYNGDEYAGFYPIDDGYLKFGAQGIRVSKFVSLLTDRMRLEDFVRLVEE